MRYKFDDFKAVIAGHFFDRDTPFPEALKLWSGKTNNKHVYYAPFEHRSELPRIALIGITPGKQQAVDALKAAQVGLRNGYRDDICLMGAKINGSFSGPMREPLVKMLDHLGIPNLIGESSSSALWTPKGYHKGQFCSLLGFPTFDHDLSNFNTRPSLDVSTAFDEMLEHTAALLNDLPPETLVLPLGETVARTLKKLQKAGLLKRELLAVENELVCLPHPSGENHESINLVSEWTYATAEEFAQASYEDYLVRQPWLKKRRKAPQKETTYKNTRIGRWNSVKRLRQTFGLPI